MVEKFLERIETSIVCNPAFFPSKMSIVAGSQNHGTATFSKIVSQAGGFGEVLQTYHLQSQVMPP